MNRKIRMGMIGGGKGSFIGAVHRSAALLDGSIELSAGAFSSDSMNSSETGKELFMENSRVYTSYDEMIEKESKMSEDLKLDFISIVTPNHLHFQPALKALEHGFHVVVEKPFTTTLAEAKILSKQAREAGLLICLTYTYSGYPMIKQAKSMIEQQKLGKIRKIYVEYPQGWLSSPLENFGNQQAAWRTNPEKSGLSGCMADIGTHAAHLAEYVSGLRITELCADLNKVVEGRLLDDDGAVLLRFEGGASGVLIATQVATGEENSIRLSIYGEKGGIQWMHDLHDSLVVKWKDKPTEIYKAGVNYSDRLSSAAVYNSRIPSGHPEGYIESFGNIYRNFACSLFALKNNEEVGYDRSDFPSADDGVRSMAFIESVVRSAHSKKKWEPLLV